MGGMNVLRGFSAFPLTPADASGRVNIAALARLLGALVAAGVDSVGLLGSTGVSAYLSRDERRGAVDAAVGTLRGQTPVIVSVGALRTDDAIDLARDAELAGADALLLAPNSYLPLTQEEAFMHYVAVAGATGVPLCVYDNPATTHFRFGDALLEKLARVPNLAGVKMPFPRTATARASSTGSAPASRPASRSDIAAIAARRTRPWREAMRGTVRTAGCCPSRRLRCAARRRRGTRRRSADSRCCSSRYGPCAGSSPGFASTTRPRRRWAATSAMRPAPSCPCRPPTPRVWLPL